MFPSKKNAPVFLLFLMALSFGSCEKDNLPITEQTTDNLLTGRWELVRTVYHSYENDDLLFTEETEVHEDHEVRMKSLLFQNDKRVTILFKRTDTGEEERYQLFNYNFQYYLNNDASMLYINEADFVGNKGVYEIIALSSDKIHLSTESDDWLNPEITYRDVTEYFYEKAEKP